MEKKEVKNSPFTLVKKENNEVLITCGNQIMCPDKFTTFKEAEEHINEKPWSLICTMMLFIISKTQEINKPNTNNND